MLLAAVLISCASNLILVTMLLQEEEAKKHLKARIEIARFFQEAVYERAKQTVRNSHSSGKSACCVNIYIYCWDI